MTPDTPPEPTQLLRQHFGHNHFLPGQEDAIRRLLLGRSVLAVFPTGGGKSLCFQLPALALDGLTLVVSPLIALMKDQVDGLQRAGIAAARLDSTLPKAEVFAIFDRMAAGELRLLYVAPERLTNERFIARLRRLRISLLAIDEAHCISEWGHNFRPEYLKLAGLARELAVERVLGLTATATPDVARDICRAFSIADDDLIQTGFHRPNLHLALRRTDDEHRDALLLDLLGPPSAAPTIVYVTLQRTAVDVARRLSSHGHEARAYHAGLADDARHSVQDAFMTGSCDIVVATIAFGMGIDKADIRRVVHYNLPKTLENYVQEIGRAGRDGQPSTCTLLAVPTDRTVLANFTYGDTPSDDAIRGLTRDLLGAGSTFDVSHYDLSFKHDIRPLVVATALTYLELDGTLHATGPFYSAYKVKLLKPQADILAGFDARRQAFLTTVLATGERARVWTTIDLGAAAKASSSDRARVVAALDYLEEQGALELRVTGLRHGYRRQLEPDPEARAAELIAKFQRREHNDIERLGQVLAHLSDDGCHTRRLLLYFGEDLGRDCGHCSRCAGDDEGLLSPSPDIELGAQERTQIDCGDTETTFTEENIAKAYGGQLPILQKTGMV